MTPTPRIDPATVIKKGDKVTIEYPNNALRAGGTVLSVIQVQGKPPEFDVVFPQIYGISGRFTVADIIAHVAV